MAELSTDVADLAFAAQRRAMVDGQIRTFDVTDLRVIQVFDMLPRETFLPAELRSLAYSDAALTLPAADSFGEARVLLRPMHLARMMQGAGIEPTDRILVVAGETGYTACLLAEMSSSVVCLESQSSLTEAARANGRRFGATMVTAETGHLAAGFPSQAPYDLIFVNGAVETNLDALLGQLAPEGRLVAIETSSRDASRRVGRAVRLQHVGGDVSRRVLFDATAPLIPEFRAAPAFVF